MKKSLLLFSILCFICTTHTSAQQLLETGNNWNVLDAFWLSATTNNYSIESDTIINGISYKQVFINGELSNDFKTPRFVRETSDGKIFSEDIFFQNTDEILLYDFSLMPGDTFVLGILGNPMGVLLIVTEVDTIMLSDGVSRRQLTFGNGSPQSTYTTTWIEGIGDIDRGPFHAHLFYFTDSDAILLCANQEGNLIYQNPSYDSCFLNPTFVQELTSTSPIKIYPNPVQNLLTLDFSTTDYSFTEINVFNTLGGSVYHQTDAANSKEIDTSQLTPGMYYVVLKEKSGTSFSKKIIKR